MNSNLSVPTFRRNSVCKLWVFLATCCVMSASPVDVGMRLELLVDTHLIERLENTRLQLQVPQPREVSLVFDAPWEKPFAGALTVLKDGPLYRMYYRGVNVNGKGEYDQSMELSCYAESDDGIIWRKPNLGLVEYKGSKENNIFLWAPRESHNFMVILDQRPGVPADEKYKGIGGARQEGLWRYISGDGIRWRRYPGKPLFAGYALDTLNVLLWSEAENCYAIYLRTWSEGGIPENPKHAGFRTISRSTSKDFKEWTKPEPMTFGNAPMEHLYTNGTTPYFRAPHILLAMPFRYVPDRRVFPDPTFAWLGVHHSQRKGISDAVLMSSRGGLAYERTFMESFVRPGPHPGAWTARSNIPGVGVVPTGQHEMSFYTTTHHSMPDYHVRRYSLRTDGFVSLNSPFTGGEMVTKPMRFAGRRLLLNYSTSVVGEIRVEVQDAAGKPIHGYTLTESLPLVGDVIQGEASWRGQHDLEKLAGQIVRLRFVMKDSDLYSLQFVK